MKKNKKAVIYFMLLLLLITTFLFGFYGKILLSPNSVLFNSNGDGIKNYYTYEYYIHNNKSFVDFEGMNYPYGENFTYTDCQPTLSFIVRVLQPIFPGLSNFSIGIFNLWLILSLALTAIILYFLLRELKVNYLLSVFGAMGIMALSPQIFRITGHYSLSYSFVIPLTIYLLLLFEKGTKRKRIFFLLTGSILFFFFVHAYLGMVAATIILAFLAINTLAQLIYQRKVTIKKQTLLLLSAALPTLGYYLFVKITDTHTGRTTTPWGITEFHAEMSSVFLPIISPLNKIKNVLFPDALQPWEGWSYVGILTIIALVLFIIFSVVGSVKTKKISLNKNWIENITLRQLFIVSLFILAFSMYVPFKWNGMGHLINYFDIIKQFRSLGRFAWVFYFVSTIMLIVITEKGFQWLLTKKNRVPAYILIILVPLSLFGEGFYQHKFVSEEIGNSPNLFDIEQVPETLRHDIESINTYHYQAILPLPFFYIGSENYGKTSNEKIAELSFLFSYHLKLPMIGGSISRTSIWESKNVMQLFASNFYHKNIQNDFPNNKPFLIICLNGFTDSTETNYLKKAVRLIQREEYSIYEISPETFFENTSAREFEEFNELKNKLYEKNGFLVSDTSLFFKFINYENSDVDISFSGNNGCLSGLQKDYQTLFSIGKGVLSVNRKYTARFWMYNDGENFGQDCLSGMIFFQQKIGDHSEWLQPFINAGKSCEINGKWSLVEVPLEHKDKEATYDLVFKGSDFAEKIIYFDDLLFYDNDLMVYKFDNLRNKISLFKNNNRIEISINENK